MGVISAINAMNASMNATRLSSVNLASALETYAAVIASPPPPPYSPVPPSIAESSQNEARGMCFTHAAVFWMEWATIQANLQLSLMQDLFKLKSLADLAGERKRGVDIEIEPHEFDVLEADSIRSMVVKLTKLSHESFQEGYKKGTDWSGVGGLNYWVTQVENYDATVSHAPNMATSKISSNLNTPPHSLTDTVELETVTEATRAEHDNASLKRKRNNGNLRGSNKTSDHDSDSSHPRQSGTDDESSQARFSDISGAFRRNAQRTAKVTAEPPGSESDYDDQVLCRYPRDEEVALSDGNPHPTPPTSHKQSVSDHTESIDIGLTNNPADISRLADTRYTDALATAAATHLPGDCNAEIQGAYHNGGEIGHDEREGGRALVVMYDSEEEGKSFEYSPVLSDRSVGSSGDADFDSFFHNTVDRPALRVDGGNSGEVSSSEGGFHNHLGGDATGKSWLKGTRSLGLECDADMPYTPDNDLPTAGSSSGIYTFHELLYAITEEGTVGGTPPRIGRINARSISPTILAEDSEHTEETRCVPTNPAIRRKGKFQKKNGCLQMLKAEGDWKSSGISEEEPANGGQEEHQLHGGIECQGNYPHQQLETPVDVGNIVDLPRHSKLGYFTEDFQQMETIMGRGLANSTHFHWEKFSCTREEPHSTATCRAVGQTDEASTFLRRMRHNCFKGGEVDSE